MQNGARACHAASFSRERCCSASSASWSARIDEVSAGGALPPMAMAGAAEGRGGENASSACQYGKAVGTEGHGCWGGDGEAYAGACVEAGRAGATGAGARALTNELYPALQIQLHGVQLRDEQAALALQGLQHRYHLRREVGRAPERVRERGQTARRGRLRLLVRRACVGVSGTWL